MRSRIPRTLSSYASASASRCQCLPSSSSAWLLPRAFSTSNPRNYALAASNRGPDGRFQLPADYVPAKQPPSAKATNTLKAQLIRSYTSLLRTTPLILLFQHMNLTGNEWAAVRRELQSGLANVPLPEGVPQEAVKHIRLQVVRSSMLEHAMKIVEFFDPQAAAQDPATASSTAHGPLVHDLSEAARRAVKAAEKSGRVDDPNTTYAQMRSLFTGPIAVLTFPTVLPAHLAKALSLLSPVPGKFPAPTRRACPSYHDPNCLSGVTKLMLLGGKVEGRIMDMDGVRWVGGIEGGVDGLRAQLVHILQGAGLGLTGALEGAGKNLWFAMEGRRTMLEDEAKGESKSAEGQETAQADGEKA